MRQPRLLVLTPDFPPAHGGVQVVSHRLASMMPGFEVELVTLASAGAERFDREDGLAVTRVRRRLRGHTAEVLALNAGAVRRALAFRPDVTLSAHVVTSPAATAIRRLLDAPAAQYFHAIEIVDKPRLAAFAAARADAAIAVSAYTAGLLAGAGAAPPKLSVIPPGVDLPGDRRPLPAERPTVLTIASLNYRYKGHDVLIAALDAVRARVPDVEWVVIGDGPLRRPLEQLASSRGIAPCARFLGEVPDGERDAWLRRAAVLAMPSRAPGEGFGIAYLEAGAYGKPVVAGNVGGPVEAVADGETGLLVDPTDASAVADALTRLLLERELAQRLGSAGAERAKAYAWPLIAGRVEASLLELARIGIP